VRLGDNWPATIAGHREVLAALLQHKPKAAKRAMRAHLAQVLEVMTGEAD
jgi:DNA-binding GntR family transcriptional regulator